MLPLPLPVVHAIAVKVRQREAVEAHTGVDHGGRAEGESAEVLHVGVLESDWPVSEHHVQVAVAVGVSHSEALGVGRTNGVGGGEDGSEVTTTPELPAWCPAQTAGWQTIDESPQSPWGVRHPDEEEPDAPTVVFLPGGSGQDMEAEMTRASFLDGADGLGAFRVVMPIAEGSKSAFDPARVAKIRAEVLRCFGGADDIVHLAGHSNGGLAAFETALDKPGKWRTLLTVPGA